MNSTHIILKRLNFKILATLLDFTSIIFVVSISVSFFLFGKGLWIAVILAIASTFHNVMQSFGISRIYNKKYSESLLRRNIKPKIIINFPGIERVLSWALSFSYGLLIVLHLFKLQHTLCFKFLFGVSCVAVFGLMLAAFVISREGDKNKFLFSLRYLGYIIASTHSSQI